MQYVFNPLHSEKLQLLPNSLNDLNTRTHSLLTGLTTDDHTQYALLAGRTGGQTVIGGSGVTDILKLQGTSGNGTLTSPAIQFLVGNNGGTIAGTILNNGNVGIGTTTPVSKVQIACNSLATGGLFLAPSGYVSGVNGGLNIWHDDNTGQTKSYIDSRWNHDSATLTFRMKVDGTPVNALTILGNGNISTTGIFTVKPSVNDVGAFLVKDQYDLNILAVDTVNGKLLLRGGLLAFDMTVERGTGGLAFNYFNLNAKNTTTGLSTLLGALGVYGDVGSGVTPPFTEYLYFSAKSTGSYSDNALRIYPDNTVAAKGNITSVGNFIGDSYVAATVGTNAAFRGMETTGGTNVTPAESLILETTLNINQSAHGAAIVARNSYNNSYRDWWGFQVVDNGNNRLEPLTLYHNGNIGLNTINPTNSLSFGGNSARTIWLERHTTADTAGNDLSLLAGACTAGATNKNAGIVKIGGTLATGSGNTETQILGSNGVNNGATSDITPAVMIDVINNKIGFFTATPVVQQLSTTDIPTALSNLGLRASGLPTSIGYGEMYMYDNSTACVIDTANVYHAVHNSFGNNDGTLAPNIDTNYFTYKAGAGYSITAFANYNSPTNTQTKVTTSGNHALLAGEPITITGTTNYNGAYVVLAAGLTATEFVITKAYVANDATGSARRPATLKVLQTGVYKAAFNVSGICVSANDVFKFEMNRNATAMDNIIARDIWTTGSNYRSSHGGGLISITANDYVWLSVKNYSGTGDLTINSGNVSLIRI